MALKLLAEKGSAVPTHLGSIPESSTKAPRRRIKELLHRAPLLSCHPCIAYFRVGNCVGGKGRRGYEKMDVYKTKEKLAR
ncbi:hypothetical protein ACO22_06070 [Paracoccidioides brasiliensis]|uniref:Uncharacterized protein n=1 Tax=Paracoccidioides brasiliensis TaxID=121759 RepID=A0A1D2J8H2_PARBR|nr:hypothetical protein ACO22_06070 [Paracoccidioides brasiliensis]